MKTVSLRKFAVSVGAVALALVQPLSAQQEVRFSLEQQMLLRCSAALALIAHGQDNGNAAALAYPLHDDSWREFFARSLARVMDETGLDNAAIEQRVRHEAQALVDNDTLESIMPACLAVLESSAG